MSQPEPGNQPQWGGQPQWGSQPPSGNQPQWGGQPHPGQAWGAPVDPRWQAAGLPPYGQPRYIAPPKPGIVPLRPLLFGEIMDGAFQTIRRNAKTMFSSALIVQIITTGLSGVASIGFLAMAKAPANGFTSQADAMSYFGPVLGMMAGLMAISLLSAVLSAILQGVLAIPVARSALNRRTGFKQMWSLARSRILPLVGYGLLLLAGYLVIVVIVALLGAIILASLGPVGLVLVLPLGLAAVAGCVWIYTKLLVAPAAITVEALGVFAGIRRSWGLTTGSWWRIFGIVLLVTVMVAVIGGVVQMPISMATGGITAVVSPHASTQQLTTTTIVLMVVSLIVSSLVGAVGVAFQTSVAALIYMDLRMRRDGLDLELLRLLETGEDPDGIPGRHGIRQTNFRPWPPASGQGYLHG
ncbi:MAG TPA: proline-rich domain-containing protein [Arthrobacter sp.]|nr:proline-rich domain-containing protein [Arthrobacter sp.]